MASSLASSLLLLLCLLLAAAAAKHELQEQLTPSPPITLTGCPDKCGNVSIPFPFGTKEGCFRPGFFVVCNHTFDPPRPFINSSFEVDDYTKYFYVDGRTHIIIEDLYYLHTKHDTWKQIVSPEETEPSLSVWPIELADVLLSEGKARLLGAFSYDIMLNETHRKVRRNSFMFGFHGISAFRLSALDNVLIGISECGLAKDAFVGLSCESYIYPFSYSGAPVNGSCTGQGCCQAYLPPDVYGSVVSINSTFFYHEVAPRSYAMIVEKTWYNFSTADLESDAFLQRNAAGVVPLIANFIIDLHGCPKASEPTPKDFACISDNSVCVDRQLAANVSAYHCNCSVGYQGNPYIHGGCQRTVYDSLYIYVIGCEL